MITPLASLLPVILYILVLKLLDSFSLVKWKRLGLCFSCGIAACLITMGLTAVSGTAIEIRNISIVPLFEEILKVALVVYLVNANRIRFLPETVIYGAAAAGGFAFLENIVYLAYNSDMMLGTAVFRGFDCAFLHIGCTALIASLFLLMKKKRKIIAIPAAIVPSAIIHFLHNAAIDRGISPAVMMISTLAFFLVLFVILFRIGEKIVYRWMDHSISVDVQTLLAIRNGNFTATKAGEYLLGMKDQFAPEVFFDMVNYVELFLDMKIERQSLMLMSQAGFTTEETEAKQAEYASKKVELFALKKNIGKTGFQVLNTIVS